VVEWPRCAIAFVVRSKPATPAGRSPTEGRSRLIYPPATQADGRRASVATLLPSDQDASGRSFGREELEHVAEVLRSGTLTATKGSFSRRFEQAFADWLGVQHAVACASGTAALHTAIAALDPEPGDEVVTTAVTDMGAIAAILYQGAIPVFADVDPATLNVTADTVAARLSERTRAIVTTHLFGNPCDMDAILAVGRAHGIPVIEDAAQAYGALSQGRPVGSLGAAGCFSAQQGKHISAGEGGVVVTNDDALGRRMRVFVNKAWPYGEADPDHEFLAPNYRITELQSAVLLAQLVRLADNVQRRIDNAERLSKLLADIPGVTPPVVAPGDTCSYWRYALRVDTEVLPGGPVELARRLRFHDIASTPRYVAKPAFRCKVIAEQATFGSSRWPFTLARPEALDHAPERFPGTFAGLDQVLVLGWNERMTEEHVDVIARGIGAAMSAETASE
jgi:dTDP-4-amino-4,6-dideoxygalactose transaminase